MRERLRKKRKLIKLVSSCRERECAKGAVFRAKQRNLFSFLRSLTTLPIEDHSFRESFAASRTLPFQNRSDASATATNRTFCCLTGQQWCHSGRDRRQRVRIRWSKHQCRSISTSSSTSSSAATSSTSSSVARPRQRGPRRGACPRLDHVFRLRPRSLHGSFLVWVAVDKKKRRRKRKSFDFPPSASLSHDEKSEKCIPLAPLLPPLPGLI